MFLDVKTWVYGKLTSNAALLQLVPVTQILSAWPNAFGKVPIVTLMESGQMNGSFADDAAIANDVTLELHVFTAYTVSTTTIAKAVDVVMSGLKFTLTFSSELSEPQTKVRHRVMRYLRGSTTAAEML